MTDYYPSPFQPVEGWVWTVFDRWNRYSGAVLGSARDSDVLLGSLISDPSICSVRTYTFVPGATNNAGEKIDSWNYTRLKELRKAR